MVIKKFCKNLLNKDIKYLDIISLITDHYFFVCEEHSPMTNIEFNKKRSLILNSKIPMFEPSILVGNQNKSNDNLNYINNKFLLIGYKIEDFNKSAVQNQNEKDFINYLINKDLLEINKSINTFSQHIHNRKETANFECLFSKSLMLFKYYNSIFYILRKFFNYNSDDINNLSKEDILLIEESLKPASKINEYLKFVGKDTFKLFTIYHTEINPTITNQSMKNYCRNINNMISLYNDNKFNTCLPYAHFVNSKISSEHNYEEFYDSFYCFFGSISYINFSKLYKTFSKMNLVISHSNQIAKKESYLLFNNNEYLKKIINVENEKNSNFINFNNHNMTIKEVLNVVNKYDSSNDFYSESSLDEVKNNENYKKLENKLGYCFKNIDTINNIKKKVSKLDDDYKDFLNGNCLIKKYINDLIMKNFLFSNERITETQKANSNEKTVSSKIYNPINNSCPFTGVGFSFDSINNTLKNDIKDVTFNKYSSNVQEIYRILSNPLTISLIAANLNLEPLLSSNIDTESQDNFNNLNNNKMTDIYPLYLKTKSNYLNRQSRILRIIISNIATENDTFDEVCLVLNKIFYNIVVFLSTHLPLFEIGYISELKSILHQYKLFLKTSVVHNKKDNTFTCTGSLQASQSLINSEEINNINDAILNNLEKIQKVNANDNIFNRESLSYEETISTIKNLENSNKELMLAKEFMESKGITECETIAEFTSHSKTHCTDMVLNSIYNKYFAENKKKFNLNTRI